MFKISEAEKQLLQTLRVLKMDTRHVANSLIFERGEVLAYVEENNPKDPEAKYIRTQIDILQDFVKSVNDNEK